MPHWLGQTIMPHWLGRAATLEARSGRWWFRRPLMPHWLGRRDADASQRMLDATEGQGPTSQPPHFSQVAMQSLP